MSRGLQERCDDARNELKEWLLDNLHIEPHDTIFEIADGAVPIYNYDLAELGANCLELMNEEPDLGPAFDGRNTPLNLLASNVFMYIEQDLWEYHREWERELKQLEDELAWAEDEIDEWLTEHAGESPWEFLEEVDGRIAYDTNFFDADYVEEKLCEFHDELIKQHEVTNDQAG